MRNFIDIIEGTSAPFRLNPALNPDNYVMTDSFRDLKKWRAMTYSCNSGGKGCPKKGELGEVGYIMISIKDNTIIPMSRSDEHHMGTDTLYDLGEKIRHKNK